MKQLYRLSAFVLAAIAASVSLIAAGCSGDLQTGPDPVYETELITIALPYVEAMRLPDEIRAGQPFIVTFDLSCDQNPTALRSPAHPFEGDLYYDAQIIGGVSVEDHDIGFRLYRDLSQANSISPVIAQISFDVKGLSAGTHQLGYISARTRAEGGIPITINKRDWTWKNGADPLPYIHTFDVTVLP